MIATHDNRRLYFSPRDQFIQREAEFVALAVTQPANPRRQSLKLHTFLRQLDPARQMFIVRKHFEDKLVRPRDVRSFAGKRCPAKRPFPFAKKWSDIRRNKSRKVISILYAVFERERSDIVTVIKGDRA